MLNIDLIKQCQVVIIPVTHDYKDYIHQFPLIDINLVNSYHQINDRAINFTSQLLQKYYLAHILQISPNAINISINQYHKPELISHPELKFNISHSYDYVVLTYLLNTNAISIGVDIEYIDDNLNVNELQHIVYSDYEIELINASNDKHDSFFRLWTKKEALIKALGTGFGTDDYKATQLNLSLSWQYDKYSILTQKILDKYYLSICIID